MTAKYSPHAHKKIIKIFYTYAFMPCYRLNKSTVLKSRCTSTSRTAILLGARGSAFAFPASGGIDCSVLDGGFLKEWKEGVEGNQSFSYCDNWPSFPRAHFSSHSFFAQWRNEEKASMRDSMWRDGNQGDQGSRWKAKMNFTSFLFKASHCLCTSFS